MLVKHIALLEKVLLDSHELVQYNLQAIHQGRRLLYLVSTVSCYSYAQELQGTWLGEQKGFWKGEQFAGGKCQ